MARRKALGQKAWLNLQPFADDMGSPLAVVRPALRKAIVDHFVGRGAPTAEVQSLTC